MTPDQSIFIAAAEVRKALVQPGDIRAEVEFQNDINGLLARIDDGVTLGAAAPSPAPPASASSRALRIITGGAGAGAGQVRAGAQPPPFRLKMTGTG